MGVTYSYEPRKDKDIYSLYEELGWNAYLHLTQAQLVEAMKQSWIVVYAYHGIQLIGTGRVISDGITNAYLCGLGVKESFRGKGIGAEIVNRLISECEDSKLHMQLLSSDELVTYYEKLGFHTFTIGMKHKK